MSDQETPYSIPPSEQNPVHSEDWYFGAETGFLRGVAETEAAWPCPNCLPCSQCENISHDERANGVALAALAEIAADNSNLSRRFRERLKDALATYNASQGPEESHAE